MAEQYVQVPVSLLVKWNDDLRSFLPIGTYAILGELASLLSQPTPTAEPCSIKREFVTEAVYCAVHGREGGWPCKVTAEPPRIEGMAPGTTCDNYFCHEPATTSAAGFYWCADHDPYTIRDVTPPKDAA